MGWRADPHCLSNGTYLLILLPCPCVHTPALPAMCCAIHCLPVLLEDQGHCHELPFHVVALTCMSPAQRLQRTYARKSLLMPGSLHRSDSVSSKDASTDSCVSVQISLPGASSDERLPLSWMFSCRKAKKAKACAIVVLLALFPDGPACVGFAAPCSCIATFAILSHQHQPYLPSARHAFCACASCLAFKTS